MGLRDHDLDLEKHDRPDQVDDRAPLDALIRAMHHASNAIRAVGPDRIEELTVTKDRICLQPAHLDDGERIARTLGCDHPLNHRMIAPGHTLWTGDVGGVEIQVRSVLRQPIGNDS